MVVVVVVAAVVVVASVVVAAAVVVGASVVDALLPLPPLQAASTAVAATATAAARRIGVLSGVIVMGTSELTKRGAALFQWGMRVEQSVERAEASAVAHA